MMLSAPLSNPYPPQKKKKCKKKMQVITPDWKYPLTEEWVRKPCPVT